MLCERRRERPSADARQEYRDYDERADDQKEIPSGDLAFALMNVCIVNDVDDLEQDERDTEVSLRSQAVLTYTDKHRVALHQHERREDERRVNRELLQEPALLENRAHITNEHRDDKKSRKYRIDRI